MTSAWGLLGVGLNGMNAHAFGTQNASTNASNVGTEGYSRRMADIRSLDGYLGSQGNGSRRVIDKFVERRMLGANAYHGEASAESRALSILDVAFGDAAGNLAETMDEFNAAITQLVSYPNDPGSRSVFLVRAEQLGNAFRTIDGQLTAAQADVNAELREEVAALNVKLNEIGDLGQKIATAEISGQEASGLRDRRDQLIREVAEAVPVKVMEEDNGHVTLMLAGSRPLVNSVGEVTPLATSIDANGNTQITRMASGQAQDMSDLITTGRIGGLISARDGALADTKAKLDQFAYDFAAAYNAAHSVGVGLDGSTGTNLFDDIADVAGAASRLSLNSDIKDNPDLLATATDAATLPGDNRGALALQAIQDAQAFLGGTATAAEAYGNIVGTAASAVQDASLREQQAAASSEQLQMVRESVSGVNTDEEMVSMIKYQRGYQATLKVISTADEMILDLLGLKR